MHTLHVLPMGHTYIYAEVKSGKHAPQRVRMLVDSGATYSLLPKHVWKKLGLSAQRREGVDLADGTQIEREVSECRIKVKGIEGSTPVFLGEDGDEPLLGVITLENLGLILHPFQRTLLPMRLRL